MPLPLDPNVYDLAASWLPTAHKDTVTRLARMLQQDLEDFCAEYVAEESARDEEKRSLKGATDAELERF